MIYRQIKQNWSNEISLTDENNSSQKTKYIDNSSSQKAIKNY